MIPGPPRAPTFRSVARKSEEETITSAGLDHLLLAKVRCAANIQDLTRGTVPPDARWVNPQALVDQHTRCAGNFTGAPELSLCIDNTCGAFDGRVHVWDAAAREWLLPRVAALSESKAAADALRAMIKRMLAPDPSKRPAFPELLEELT